MRLGAAGGDGHVQARCDLRGLRLDAAERALEKALDQCLSEGLATLWVVHGHGTGVLRQGVRELLEMSPYVAAMRPADAQEGGDGVTVVTLRH
ncbi:MAG: hypothetical protein EOO40_13150 [Deltaproteobacteria bacterium]|nr:MAG: hypothetical protein EOO40_13150 [Deltaproteobacteria bacterium]